MFRQGFERILAGQRFRTGVVAYLGRGCSNSASSVDFPDEVAGFSGFRWFCYVGCIGRDTLLWLWNHIRDGIRQCCHQYILIIIKPAKDRN